MQKIKKENVFPRFVKLCPKVSRAKSAKKNLDQAEDDSDPCRRPYLQETARDRTVAPQSAINEQFRQEIARRKEIEKSLIRCSHELAERTKELNCLSGIACLIGKEDLSLEETLQGIVDLIPSAWQYPEITCARLILKDQTFTTRNFKETIWKQASAITFHNEVAGALEVYYLEEKPKCDEGPFLKEERNLINIVERVVRKIIQREWAEEELRAEKQRLFNILDNIPASIHIQARDYSIRFANRYFRESRGVPQDRKCYEILAGRKEPCEGCQTMSIFGMEGFIGWRNLISPDGRIYDVYEYPFTDSDGSPLVMELSFDITDRKLAEDALRESEEKFRLVTETVQDVFWMTTPGVTETIYISPAYERIFGRSRDDVYRDSLAFIEAIHPDDREQVIRGIRENPTGIWDFEYRVVRPDGSIRWIQDRGFPVWDRSGNLSRMVGVATDITERKFAEEKLDEYRKHLEALVSERTAQLQAANEQLQREISERRQAEEEARLAYAELRQIFNATAEGMCVIDKNFTLLEVNDAFCILLGLDRSEVMGKNCYTVFRHTLCNTPACPLSHILRGEDVFEYELEMEQRNGTKIPCLLTAAPLQGPNGELIGIVENFKDIIERKKMEGALKTSQAQMAEAQRLAHVGSWDWDIRTDTGTWSEELCRIFGTGFQDRIEPFEESLAQFVHPDDRDDFLSLFHEACLNKKPFEYQHRIVRPDGSLRRAQGRGVVFTDEAGNPVKITGFIQDVTEIKEAEDALRASEKKYRQLIENAQEGIWAIDSECRTTFVNSQMAEMIGYTVDEMIGKPVISFLDEQSAALFNRSFELRRQGIKERHEFELRHKDGSRVYTNLDSSPIIDDNGNFTGVVALVSNITGRKLAEEEKQKIQAQLLQSQKMEAIGILAGGVAHDFNNLLTTIIGYTSMAIMKIDKADPVFRDLSQVRLNADRAANLTRQLLLFSRKQPMEPVPIGLNRTVDNLLRMLHRLIGEDIAINAELEPDLWPIQADEGNIEQVIMNLAVNARDAMPQGGRLTIKTENITLDEEFSAMTPEARPGRFVRLSIADTGCGMDQETMSRIFEPFYTTKGLGKGTGLGLSVVYGIVKQHEGWINTYSEPGKGSVFKIYLPASCREENGKAQKSETIPLLQRFQGKGERIFVVEDEEDVRRMTVKVLHENGYTVTEAANAQQALDVFHREGGEFNLVLSDVVLPDQSGPELVNRLLSYQPKIRVLLMSGYTDQKARWSTIKKQGFRFLQKPFALPDLLKTLRDILEPDIVT
ncbi:MAG: PAS domain S-box protein [bacterium]